MKNYQHYVILFCVFLLSCSDGTNSGSGHTTTGPTTTGPTTTEPAAGIAPEKCQDSAGIRICTKIPEKIYISSESSGTAVQTIFIASPEVILLANAFYGREARPITYVATDLPDWCGLRPDGSMVCSPLSTEIGKQFTVGITPTIPSYPDISLHPISGTIGVVQVGVSEGGLCTAKNYKQEQICSDVSAEYLTQQKCEIWAAYRYGLDDVRLHVGALDSLKQIARNLSCNSLDNLPSDETQRAEVLVKEIADTMVGYIRDVGKYPIAEYKYKPFRITTYEGEPDKTTLSIPMPPGIQRSMAKVEKQAKVESDLNIDLGGLTDCSVDKGSFWNRSVCYSWHKSFPKDIPNVPEAASIVGLEVDAMAYLKMSGEALASFQIELFLFGKNLSELKVPGLTVPKIVDFSFSSQVIPNTPKGEIPDLNQFNESKISLSDLGEGTKTLDTILQNVLKNVPPAAEVIGNQLMNQLMAEVSVLKEAKNGFDTAKYFLEEASSKTQIEIDGAREGLKVATEKLDNALNVFNTAKIAAEKAAAILTKIDVKEVKVEGHSKVIGKTVFKPFTYTSVPSPSNPSPSKCTSDPSNPSSLTCRAEDFGIPPFKDGITTGVIPVAPIGIVSISVEATIGAESGVTPTVSILNALDPAKAAVAFAWIPRFKSSVDLKVFAQLGVGDFSVLDAGGKGTLTLLDTDVRFLMEAKAQDFIDNKLPLLLIDWQAETLSGKLAAFINFPLFKLVTNMGTQILDTIDLFRNMMKSSSFGQDQPLAPNSEHLPAIVRQVDYSDNQFQTTLDCCDIGEWVEVFVEKLDQFGNFVGEVAGRLRDYITELDEITQIEYVFFEWDGLHFPNGKTCDGRDIARGIIYCSRKDDQRCMDRCAPAVPPRVVDITTPEQTANNVQVVRDNLTGLKWAEAPYNYDYRNNRPISFNDMCNNKSSLDELKTLIVAEKNKTGLYLDPAFDHFLHPEYFGYMESTTVACTGDLYKSGDSLDVNYWYIDFRTGESKHDPCRIIEPPPPCTREGGCNIPAIEIPPHPDTGWCHVLIR